MTRHQLDPSPSATVGGEPVLGRSCAASGGRDQL